MSDELKQGDGIIPQIIGARDNIALTELPTLGAFKDMMTSIMCKDLADKVDKAEIPETPIDGIKLKIKEGYLYMIDTVVTGYAGAMRMVDHYRHAGIPDGIIGEEIKITETEGITTNQVWTPLNKITWNK